MRVMMFVKATGDSGKAAPPTAEAFAAMDRFTEELAEAGVFVAERNRDPAVLRGGGSAQVPDPEEFSTPRKGIRGKLGVA